MSAPIRLLMIVPRYGTVNRGVEVFVHELIQHMDREHFQVAVLSGPHGLNEPGVECVERPLLERERLAPLAMPLLRYLPGRWHLGPADLEALALMQHSQNFLRTRTFDVILPFGGTWTYRFASWRRHGARIVGVGHAGPVKSDLLLSDLFVALTPADEALARTMRPEMRTCVIPNGVDAVRFRAPDVPLARDGSVRTILCAAALTPDKRHDLLFDAVMRMDAPVRLVCAGEGPLKSVLMRHPLYKQGRVEFVVKPHNEMPALYQSADVFTLASPGEAFGLVFLEALASGLPVVANDAPRQRYVVGEAGFFCNVHDADGYADSLMAALAAPSDQRRREHVAQFGWPLVAEKYQEVMVNLLFG